MTKTELIAAMATNAEITKAAAEKALQAFIEATQSSLKAGEELRIAGLGVFSIKHRPASPGRNPRTGEPIEIAATNVVGFRPSGELKRAVNS